MRGSLNYILLLVLILAMVSCGSDVATDDDNAADKCSVQVTFVLNVGGTATGGTRAISWNDNYKPETATTYENTIAADKLQVLVFAADGSYLDQLDNLSYYPSSTDNKTYEVVGTLLVDNNYVQDNKLSCKLVVLANCGKVTGVTNISDLNDKTKFNFDYTKYDPTLSSPSYIPMFGVQSYTDLTMVPGIRVNAGTIDMLRAVAKIHVKLDTDSNGSGTEETGEDIALTSVALTNYSTKGYLMPKGFYDVTTTKELTIVETDKWDWDDDNTFNPCADGNTTNTLQLIRTSDTEYYVYLPEYDISKGRPKFSVKFDFQKDSDTETFDFDFDVYKSNEPQGVAYNIERNCVYNFLIKKMKGKIYVTTGDWTDVFDNTIDFGTKTDS